MDVEGCYHEQNGEKKQQGNMKEIISLKNDRRILVKFGKVSRMRVTRFYVLHNDILMYFKTPKQEKSKSSFTLSGSEIVCEPSKIKGIKFSLRVALSSPKKRIWLHPLNDEEFVLLEKYIKYASEGKFSAEHIFMQQIMNPNFIVKHVSGFTAASSLLINQLIESPDRSIKTHTLNKEIKPSDAIQTHRSLQKSSTCQQLHQNIINKLEKTGEHKDEQEVIRQFLPKHTHRKNLNNKPSSSNEQSKQDNFNPELFELQDYEIEENLAVIVEQPSSNSIFQRKSMSRSNKSERLTIDLKQLSSMKSQENHSTSQHNKKVVDHQIDQMSQMVQQSPAAPMSMLFDFEDDIQFSSDEEDQRRKNENLKSISKVQYNFSPISPRDYFQSDNQQDATSIKKKINFQDTSPIMSPTKGIRTHGGLGSDLETFINPITVKAQINREPSSHLIAIPSNPLLLHLGNHPTSSTNISTGFQSGSMQHHFGFSSGIGEDLNTPKQISSSSNQNPFSALMLSSPDKITKHSFVAQQHIYSSNTMQHLYFPESSRHLPDSPNESFIQYQEIHLQSNSQEIPYRFSHTSLSNTQYQPNSYLPKNKSYKDATYQTHYQLSDVRDLGEEENLSEEESELGGAATHHNIKQHVFSASTRNFVEEIPVIVKSEYTPILSETPNHHNQHQLQQLVKAATTVVEAARQSHNNNERNSRMGLITDYSFDRKTINDTDLFEQEDGNFLRSIKASSRATRNQYSNQQSLVQFSNEFALKAKHPKFESPKRSRSEELETTRKNVKKQKKSNRFNNMSEKVHGNNFFQSVIGRASIPLELDSIENTELGMFQEIDQDDLDGSQPPAINNVTHIIERYRQQNILPSTNPIAMLSSSSHSSRQQQFQPSEDSEKKIQVRKSYKKTRSKSTNIELVIDTEKCNEIDLIQQAPILPRIKDKKEFYNKKNIGGYIVPKMEASINLSEMASFESAFEKGYFYLWSFEFQNAIEIFSMHRESHIGMEYALLEHYLMRIIVCGSKELISLTEKKFASFIEYIKACEKEVAKKGSKSTIKCLSPLSKLNIDLIKSEAEIVHGFLQTLLGNKFQSFLSLKSAYSCFKKAKSKIETMSERQRNAEFDIITQSRFYFVSGVFNIGLSMIPSYFLKILSLLGIKPDKEYGYECLQKCIQLNSIRSHFASLLLCIEFTELNPDLEKSVLLIKKMIKTLPQCPLFYWMAALLSWRYAKPDDALTLINRSLWNCGQLLGEQASYLRFQKGWFCVSQFDWQSALTEFEDIAILCMDIHDIDIDQFMSIATQKKLPTTTSNLIKPFVSRAKEQFSPNQQIILPHKSCLAILIACCNQHIGRIPHMDLWLTMNLYLSKKQIEGRSLIDEEITKLSGKYLTRENKRFIKFEVLYFVKEITKLREDMLQKMIDEVSEYYSTEYENFTEYAALRNQPIKAIDMASTLFLRVVGGCLQQNFSVVYSTSSQLEEISEYIPQDHAYLLHHSHHWLARCYIQQTEFQNAKDHLKKCLKYKKCEFSLENKTQKLLQEMPI